MEPRMDYSLSPAVLVCGSDGVGGGLLADAVVASGGIVRDRVPIGAAAAAVRDRLNADAVVAWLDDGDDAAAEALLAVIARRADAGHLRAVIVAPRDRIDLASRHAGHGDVDLLCEPNAADLVAAISGMIAARPARLNDSSVDPLYAQLHALGEQMGQIARALSGLSARGGGSVAAPSAGFNRWPPARPGGRGGEGPIDAAYVRALIRGRRLRESYFPADLFADPAWDILLDLTAARLEQRPVAVSSLCIAAAVPPTTALRWIKTLTDSGVLVRIADPSDGRRIFIALADDAAESMMTYLGEARRLAATPI